jgi:hypothetical protein
MDTSSKNLHQQSSDNDDASDSTNEEVTEADIEELENILPFEKPPTTNNELRLFKACQEILQNSCGVISTVSLLSRTKLDAANFLVNDCLLIFIDDLFKDEDYIEPGGFVKDVPDGFDLMFCGRLARYNVTFESYLNSVTIPDVWKARLSSNGIRFLSDITFYRNLLDLSLYKSLSHVQTMDDDHDEKENEISLIRNAQFSNQQSPNGKYLNK